MSVRFTGTQTVRRTANLPDDILFTLCGWARLTVDTNNFLVLGGIEDVTSGSPTGYFQLGTAVDGTTITLFGNGPTDTTLRAGVLGRDFFWAMTCSALAAANHIGYHRWSYERALTIAAMSGSARSAFTPAQVSVGNDAVGEPMNGRLWNVMCWDRVLTAGELLRQSLYQYPVDPTALNFWWPMDMGQSVLDWSDNRRDGAVTGTVLAEPVEIALLTRQVPRKVFFLATGGAIAGTTGMVLAASGTLSGAGALAGTASMSFGQSGSLAGAGALAGTNGMTFGQSGVLRGAGALAATVGMTFGQSGALAGAGALAGSIGMVFGQSGTLVGSASLSGSATFTFGASATANGPSGAMSGTAAMTFGQSGALGGAGALAGTCSMTFAGTATGVSIGVLSGTGVLTFGQSGTLRGAGVLAGVAGLVFGGTATAIQPAAAFTFATVHVAARETHVFVSRAHARQFAARHMQPRFMIRRGGPHAR